MKKVFLLFLTFVYLVLTTGIVFHVHYCEGKINGISLADEKNQDECCDEKESVKKNCCEEKTAVFKINDSQHSSTNLKTPAISVKSIDFCFSFTDNHLHKNIGIKNNTTAHHPPDICQNPIYLQYRILII